jgi:hypothetical protein
VSQRIVATEWETLSHCLFINLLHLFATLVPVLEPERMDRSESAEASAGRAKGALFFVGFGSIWLSTGLSTLHRPNSVSAGGVAINAGAGDSDRATFAARGKGIASGRKRPRALRRKPKLSAFFATPSRPTCDGRRDSTPHRTDGCRQLQAFPHQGTAFYAESSRNISGKE